MREGGSWLLRSRGLSRPKGASTKRWLWQVHLSPGSCIQVSCGLPQVWDKGPSRSRSSHHSVSQCHLVCMCLHVPIAGTFQCGGNRLPITSPAPHEGCSFARVEDDGIGGLLCRVGILLPQSYQVILDLVASAVSRHVSSLLRHKNQPPGCPVPLLRKAVHSFSVVFDSGTSKVNVFWSKP